MTDPGGSAAELRIAALEGLETAGICARLMSESEPWITLGRDYAKSLEQLQSPVKEVYVASLGPRVAGFTILNMRGAFAGYIQSICVDPAFRGHGIGTALMKHAEERIFRESPNAFVCVSSFNPGARRLYERLGYSPVGELYDFIVPGHSETLLRKTIGPEAAFSSPANDPTADLLAAVEQRVKAEMMGDAGMLSAIYATDYRGFDEQGNARTRESIIEAYQRGLDIKYIRLDDLDTRVRGDTGIVTGRTLINGTLRGKAFARELCFTEVYARRGGGWTLIASQATEERP